MFSIFLSPPSLYLKHLMALWHFGTMALCVLYAVCFLLIHKA